jgi:hypothetical protein
MLSKRAPRLGKICIKGSLQRYFAPQQLKLTYVALCGLMKVHVLVSSAHGSQSISLRQQQLPLSFYSYFTALSKFSFGK